MTSSFQINYELFLSSVWFSGIHLGSASYNRVNFLIQSLADVGVCRAAFRRLILGMADLTIVTFTIYMVALHSGICGI